MIHRQPRAAVLGAGGFIGSHLVRRLRTEGYHVRGVDRHPPEFSTTEAQEFILADLRDPVAVSSVLDNPFDEVYQLAADMGGAGYVFTGEHDADIMHNSALINLHVADRCRALGVGRLLYTSSACIYPAFNQTDALHPVCTEDSAYPAEPDSEYGWEKLFGERLFLAYARTSALAVRIVRLHNVFGPEGVWHGGREKAPAALCRKVAEAPAGSEIEIWGDGQQTRSFLYIDDCIEGLRRVMKSEFAGPVNLGSEEMVAIDDLARMIIALSGKSLGLRHVPGPVGVRGRTSDNRLLRRVLDWAPGGRLAEGVAATYTWIEERVRLSRSPEDAP
jgi:nucleoside-diphosphate-sugar epimerase